MLTDFNQLQATRNRNKRQSNFRGQARHAHSQNGGESCISETGKLNIQCKNPFMMISMYVFFIERTGSTVSFAVPTVVRIKNRFQVLSLLLIIIISGNAWIR